MSKEHRIQKRKNKKRLRLIIGAVILLAIIMIIVIQYRKNRVELVNKTVYQDTYVTDVYFFKDIDYIQLDNFDVKALTVPEGNKVNGYMSLTTAPLTVNQEYLKLQIETIDMIIQDGIYKNWTPIMNEIGESFVGKSKVQSQINGTAANDRKRFLVNAARYMGYSVEKLQALKEKMQELSDGAPREIKLNSLGMKSTGYVYSTVNSMEKVVSERVLPYINTDVLSKLGKIDRQNSSALKVINNDHMYAAVEMLKNVGVNEAEDVLKLKKEFFGRTDTENNSEYFEMLVRREDMLRCYPKITLNKEGKGYDAYMVDIFPSGKGNIVILLLKDYVNVFADDDILEMAVDVNEYEAYTVEESAVFEEDGKSYIKKMATGLFVENIPVKVQNVKNGKAYLPVWENPDVTKDMSYKVYP